MDQDAFEGQLRTKLRAHAQVTRKAQQASPPSVKISALPTIGDIGWLLLFWRSGTYVPDS